MIKTAVILAGGLGTRLRDVVPNLPKPMAPIRNRPFLEHQMDYWIDQGIDNFILSLGYLKDLIIDHFGNSYKGASIEYVIESKPLGTGGALIFSAQKLKETFLVLNGDTFIELDLEIFFQFHLKVDSKWTMALFNTSNFDRYMGVDLSPNGEVMSLKSKEVQSNSFANGGVYLVDPLVLNSLNYKKQTKLSLEDDLLPNFISNGGAIYGQECKGRFIDIGVPRDYYEAKYILPPNKK
jgi:D-glycero-alpha-D-manno-heptose 1-phosphate guanylyltransferase